MASRKACWIFLLLVVLVAGCAGGRAEDSGLPEDTGTEDTGTEDTGNPEDTGIDLDSGVPEDTQILPDAVPDLMLFDVGCSSDLQCDDMNVCTTDMCDTMRGACVHTGRMGCCNTVVECDDGNVCTNDSCNPTMNVCEHAALAGCCLIDTDCSDTNACTTDTCEPMTHLCQHPAIMGCCNMAAECNDMNMCTTDSCDSMHVCAHTGIMGCCTMNSQCDDTNVCTTDTCSSGTCMNARMTGCCTSPADCNDRNACTNDTCTLIGGGRGACTNAAIPVSGDNCSSIRTLSAPSVYTQTVIADTTCARNDFTTGGGNDLVFQFTLGTGNWLFYVDTVGSSWDTVLSITSGGCPGTEVVRNDDRCGVQSQIVRQLAGGTYHLVVDGYSSGSHGLVQVHYRAVQIPTGMTVAEITRGTRTVTGSTGLHIPFSSNCFPVAGAQTMLQQSCATGTVNGYERVYYTALCNSTTAVTASLCGTSPSWDTVLALRTYLTGTSSVVCNDNGPLCSPRSQISYTVGTAGLYFLVVDGFDIRNCGNFSLALTGF